MSRRGDAWAAIPTPRQGVCCRRVHLCCRHRRHLLCVSDELVPHVLQQRLARVGRGLAHGQQSLLCVLGCLARRHHLLSGGGNAIRGAS